MKFHRLTNRWQQLPEKEVRRLQIAKWRHYLETVVLPFSPRYRSLFGELGLQPRHFRSLEDLRHIPFTSKIDLVNTPERPKRALDYLIQPDPKILSRRLDTIMHAVLFGKESVKAGFEREFRPVFLTSTTGRSADPIPFLYTRHDLDVLSLGGDRIMQVCRAAHEFRLVNMFPYAPHLAFWLAHYASTSFGVFTVGSGGGKVLGTEGNLRLMKKIDPHGLIGMPTFLYHVMQQAIEEGMQCPNLCRLVLGGEKVAPGMRRKLGLLAKRLGASNVSVLATYGFTEAKMAWGECPTPAGSTSSGYHLYPDLGLIEVIDPETGVTLPPGHPGELVFTPLEARGTVVIRYRTGDLIDGGLTYEPCPHCGRTVPRLVGNISRNSEIKSMQLEKIKGTLVDFNQLEHVLDDTPNVDAWQLEIRKVNDDPLDLDELILHVHKAAHATRETLTRDLTNRFVERTEIRPNRILFHNASEIRRLLGVGTQLKELKIVDNRPLGRPGNPVAGNRVVSRETAASAVSRATADFETEESTRQSSEVPS